ncbi:tRNA1(Val) (adenine(37)-N6)-methyltransferase [Acidaminobacterium chupaoyuni]
MIRNEKLFDGFTLLQSDDFFKLTQDSVLLSEWLKLKKGQRALELGTGCGGLWLLAAAKNPGCRIDGLELQEGALAIARENQRQNGLEEQGELIQADLTVWNGRHQYDVCFCNPPYFEPQKTLTAPHPPRAAARSQQACSMEAVCAAAGRALRQGGLFYFCFRPGNWENAQNALMKNGFALKRLRMVHQTAEKPAQLMLCCAAYGGGAWLEIEPPLLLKELSGEESMEYRRIYRRHQQENRKEEQ